MWTGSWTFLPFCPSQNINIGQYVHAGQQFRFSKTTLREGPVVEHPQVSSLITVFNNRSTTALL